MLLPPAPDALLEPVLNALDAGVMVVDAAGSISLVNDPLCVMFGLEPAQIRQLTPEAFALHLAALSDDPPQLLRNGKLFPGVGQSIVCEEFELARPTRSVVRWVARRINAPAALLVVCTDITAEVELSKRLELLAVQDQLTGLTNRRGAEAVLNREVVRCRRYRTPLSLVMFDVDHFKKVNDTWGHDAGDQVLVRVARAMAGQLRDTDLVARWGGEEFLMVLTNTAAEPARICAERIRLCISRMDVPGVGTVTLSGGIAEYEGQEPLNQTIARADARMYEAKRGGRNRVV